MTDTDDFVDLSTLDRPKVQRFYGHWEDVSDAMWGRGEAMTDNVNHPAHYNSAGIECIDAMEAMVEGAEVDAHIAYCWQNAFKYLWRWPYKNGLEDLKKARWYLDRIIQKMEGG